MMHSGDGRAASGVFLLLLSLCAGGAARAQNANLTVADFEGGKAETVQGLAFVVIADEQVGGTSGAKFALVHPGANGSRGALRISYRLTGDFPAPFASAWGPLGTEGLPADLSAYRGLRFQARSKAKAFVAGFGQFSGQAALYTAAFEARPEWTLIELPFDKFQRALPKPDGSVMVPRDVVAVAFNVSAQPRGEFELEIDQVELYK